MAARTPYVLAIEDSSSVVSEGHEVRLTNRSTGEILVGIFDDEYHCVVDINGEGSGFTTEISEDDVIEIKITGKYEAFTTHTVDLVQGGCGITLTTSALSSNTTEVSL